MHLQGKIDWFLTNGTWESKWRVRLLTQYGVLVIFCRILDCGVWRRLELEPVDSIAEIYLPDSKPSSGRECFTIVSSGLPLL